MTLIKNIIKGGGEPKKGLVTNEGRKIVNSGDLIYNNIHGRNILVQIKYISECKITLKSKVTKPREKASKYMPE